MMDVSQHISDNPGHVRSLVMRDQVQDRVFIFARKNQDNRAAFERDYGDSSKLVVWWNRCRTR